MKNNQNINLILYYDKYYQPLMDLFIYPSYEKYLSNNFKLREYKSTLKNDTNEYGFNTKYWSQILIDRFDILKDFIKTHPNEWCVFSDIDILYLDNFFNELNLYINNYNEEIFYMPEFIHSRIYNVNGGFFLFKCTEHICDYFELVQNNTKNMQNPNDQQAIKEILKNNNDYNIKYNILNRLTFVTNNHDREKIINLINYNKMKVFHATGSFNLMEKVQILSSIYLEKYKNK